MTRTVIGLSFSIAMVLGGAIACGSKSTDDSNATAGNGSVLAGGNSGGTSGSGAGASSGGTRAGGGTTSTAGTTSAGGVCADQTVTCVDATHAMGCNLDTGVVENFSCVDELKAIGIVSSGCTPDALNGDSCSIDDFSDQACADGTSAFAYCENATSDEQVFNIYVNCFQDFMSGHTVIPCFSTYVTPMMKTADNCLAAETACLGGDVGAGGAATGAGGAP